jgi:hypothetical protein
MPLIFDAACRHLLLTLIIMMSPALSIRHAAIDFAIILIIAMPIIFAYAMIDAISLITPPRCFRH